MQIVRFTIGSARALAGMRFPALYQRFVRRSVDSHQLIGRPFGLTARTSSPKRWPHPVCLPSSAFAPNLVLSCLSRLDSSPEGDVPLLESKVGLQVGSLVCPSPRSFHPKANLLRLWPPSVSRLNPSCVRRRVRSTRRRISCVSGTLDIPSRCGGFQDRFNRRDFLVL